MGLVCISVILGWCSLVSVSNIGNVMSYSVEYNWIYSCNVFMDVDVVFYNLVVIVVLFEGFLVLVSNMSFLVWVV